MRPDQIREATKAAWNEFYTFSEIWKRSRCTKTLRSRLAFVLISQLYRHMYAGSGISTDSARHRKAQSSARWIAKYCRRLFQAKPMPELQAPALRLASQEHCAPPTSFASSHPKLNILE